MLLTSIYNWVWQPSALSLPPPLSAWKGKSEVCLIGTGWCAVSSEASAPLAVEVCGHSCTLACIFVQCRYLCRWACTCLHSYGWMYLCLFCENTQVHIPGECVLSTYSGRCLHCAQYFVHSVCSYLQIYGFWLYGFSKASGRAII